MDQSFEKTEEIKSYVQAEMAQNITTNDAHADRVREMIIKMLNK